jgi:hypothetical protein
LDVDPDLGRGIGETRREQARRDLWVAVDTAAPGGWEPPGPVCVGLLLLDGVVAREVLIGREVSTELLGAGDLVRPWAAGDADAFVTAPVRWNVLATAQFAVLGAEFAARSAGHPAIGLALLERLELRAHRLATLRAIGQLIGVDERLLAVLWHLSERWGRVTRDGVALPLSLSHRTLGQLIGARRPSVSAAATALSRDSRLTRLPDGAWLLHGEPVALAPAGPVSLAPRRALVVSRHVPAPLPAGMDALADLLADETSSAS